jgi:hypothetical protein
MKLFSGVLNTARLTGRVSSTRNPNRHERTETLHIRHKEWHTDLQQIEHSTRVRLFDKAIRGDIAFYMVRKIEAAKFIQPEIQSIALSKLGQSLVASSALPFSFNCSTCRCSKNMNEKEY